MTWVVGIVGDTDLESDLTGPLVISAGEQHLGQGLGEFGLELALAVLKDPAAGTNRVSQHPAQ